MPPALYKLDPTLNLKKGVLLHTGGNLFYAIHVFYNFNSSGMLQM